MNGVHDMGGMHGMGPIQHEKNEPVFHARWEGRVFALSLAMGAWRKWNIDASRHEIELIPAAEYLRMSYYENGARGSSRCWSRAAWSRARRSKAASRRQARPRPLHARSDGGQRVRAMHREGHVWRAGNVPGSPALPVGQRVRARNIHPTGHTRLPRYARGKLGTIDRDHGVFVFPDTNAHFLGEKPQHVYSVRFAARELWGEQASPRDAVYIDMWDDYLEPA